MSRRVKKVLETWWIKTSVPDRVEACRRAGLPGRTGSKRYKDLNADEREALRREVMI
jgi:hypothetical protein